MTDGDGLTSRVLLGSGGFSNAVCAKQVCILKTPLRGKVNKPQLTHTATVGTSHDRWKQARLGGFFLFNFYE